MYFVIYFLLLVYRGMDIPTPTNYLPNPIYSKSSQFEYSYILMTPDFFYLCIQKLTCWLESYS